MLREPATTPWGERVAYVLDPDANPVALAILLPPNDIPNRGHVYDPPRPLARQPRRGRGDPVRFAVVDLPLYAKRLADRRAARAVETATTAVVTAWRTPKQRQLSLAVAAALLSAIAFARIAEDYLTNDPLARWDLTFARWLSGERSTTGTDFFRAVTFVGSPATAAAIAAVVCVLLYRRRRLIEAALLPVVVAGTELLNVVLKLSFHRSRPEVASVHLDTYSFPSGHAMISTALYGALAYLAWSRVRGRGTRVALILGTAAFLALICFSRLYLGVHYLSDVLAGTAGGAFWLAASIAAQTTYGDRFAGRFAGSRVDRLAHRITRR